MTPKQDGWDEDEKDLQWAEREVDRLRATVRTLQEDNDLARQRIVFLEKEIIQYVNRPGCNAPAKKKALQRLTCAVTKENNDGL